MPAEQDRQPCEGLGRAAVVAPAWNAGAEFPALLRELSALGFAALIVVDDGSCADYAPWIREAAAIPGVRLVRHETNRGKGCALKTGFSVARGQVPRAEVVVTADADGQHVAADVARVACAALAAQGRMVLGGRTFGRGVPLRSWIGNALTRWLFAARMGMVLRDTQTGLRAFPRAALSDLLAIEGERYEYEMAVLAQFCRRFGKPVEVEITTVYRAGNRGSHFRPWQDSVRVWWALLRGGKASEPNPSPDVVSSTGLRL